MKKLVVLLIVLAISAVSGLNMAGAQEGTYLKVLTLDTVTLLAAPDAAAEVVVEVAPYTTGMLLGTDESGLWFNVETADGAGYAPAESFLVLNLPALAPKAYVDTRRTGVTAMYVAPNITADFTTTVEEGVIGTVLGVYEDQWAYIETEVGTGWFVYTDWTLLPDGAKLMHVVTRRVPQIGIYAEPSITADIATTVDNGAVLYWLGEPDGQFVEVLLPDATTGFAVSTDFDPLPTVMAVAQTRRTAQVGVFAEAAMTADVVGTLPEGATVYVREFVDDNWMEIFHPSVGTGYVLRSAFSDPYSFATVQVGDSVVRQGPNDNVYDAVATLPAGTKVIVKGVNASGAWIQVAFPYSEVDWGYNGVDGWMRDFLFVDGLGNTDLDASVLATTSDE